MRIFLLILTCILSSNVLANALNCDPIPIQNDAIVLKSPKSRLVLFHNTSAHNVYITHQAEESEATAWSSMIEPDKWSLLLVTPQQLSLRCIESVPGHEQFLPCQHLLSICQAEAPKEENQEVKWIAENSTQHALPLLTKSVVH